MSSPLAAAVVGLGLWGAAIALAWHAYAARRRLPGGLYWPGFLAALPAAFVLRGLFGEASAALPALAYLVAAGGALAPAGRRLLGALVFSALALYLSALGLLESDLYAVAYSPGWLSALAAGAALAAYAWVPPLGWAWLLGLGLSAAGLHPSPNLFDALVDVPSVFAAALLAARRRDRRPPAD